MRTSAFDARERPTAELEAPGASQGSGGCKHQSSHPTGPRAAGIGDRGSRETVREQASLRMDEGGDGRGRHTSGLLRARRLEALMSSLQAAAAAMLAGVESFDIPGLAPNMHTGARPLAGTPSGDHDLGRMSGLRAPSGHERTPGTEVINHPRSPQLRAIPGSTTPSHQSNLDAEWTRSGRARSRSALHPSVKNTRIAGKALCRTRTDDPLPWKDGGVSSVHTCSLAGTNCLQPPKV
jgi:hypothetical protein